MKALSPIMAATLAFGLRDDSRVKKFISGQKYTLIETLLARCVDELAFISWSKTKDAQKNRNRPESILKALLEPPKDENETFRSGEDFRKAWEKING